MMKLNTLNTERKVFDHIMENQLLSAGDRVIAGVSGGADSMCMLLLLMSFADELDLKITVAHVDHGIRGSEAEADARFVGDFCLTHGLETESVKADIPAMAERTGQSLEEAGRSFRYEFFRETAEKYGANKIAVAHNSGDNAETVLFNIFRGSGIDGLKGILPSRPAKKGDTKIELIRPILCLSRREIEEYLDRRGQKYCTDSTNSDDAYSRNRIRNTILPTAERYINSNVEGHISRLSVQARETENFIDEQSRAYMGFVRSERDRNGDILRCILDYSEISKLHPVLRRKLLRNAFEMTAGKLKDVEEIHIREADGLFFKQSGKKLDLPYGLTAVKEYDRIVLEKGGLEKEKSTVGVNLKVFERTALKGDIPRKENVKWFDYDKIGSMPVLRTRAEGDYLLIGSKRHRKSLNRFMIDNKIPLSERDNILLLTVGSHVLWVVGYRQDESCPVTGDTLRVLVAEKTV